MKKFIFITLLLATLSGFAFSQTEKRSFENLSKAGQEVLTVIDQWREAMIVRDFDMLHKIFSEDVIITTFGGKTRGKEAELEAVKPNPDFKTVSITNEDIRVKVYGQTSVVTALTKMHSKFKEKDIKIEFRYTSVFTKKEGRWQMVALHISRIDKPKTK